MGSKKKQSKETSLSNNHAVIYIGRKCAPLTNTIWSPLLKLPLRSAGAPARMKEIKIPSPSSPPTILNPRPEGPRINTTVRCSLVKNEMQ